MNAHTKGECDRALKQAVIEEKERRKIDSDTQNFLICLPDTVDPRGAKAR